MTEAIDPRNPDLIYTQYRNETQLKELTDLIDAELSEPYNIFTYRFFVNNNPELTYFVYHNNVCIGGILSSVSINKNKRRKGYIGMLVVHDNYRGRGIASTLVRLSVANMYRQGIDICLLETEVENTAAMSLYEKLGFIRTKFLPRYYLNNSDAYRLKFWLSPTTILTLRDGMITREADAEDPDDASPDDHDDNNTTNNE